MGKKKNNNVKVIIMVLIFFGFIGGVIYGINHIINNPDLYTTEIVFDATKFYIDENSTVSQDQLIEMIGEPDKTEEWNHATATRSYPINTFYYYNGEEEYAYHFNNEMLQRISINSAKIPYTDKNKILKMFGLTKYFNSFVVADTGFAYRIENCGVRQFWIPIMNDEYLESIRIDYGNVFLN